MTLQRHGFLLLRTLLLAFHVSAPALGAGKVGSFAAAVVSTNPDYKFFNWFQIELGEPFAGITLSATGEPDSNDLTIFGVTLDDPVNVDQGTYCTLSLALGQASIQHADFDIGGQAQGATPLGPAALQLMKDYAAALKDFFVARQITPEAAAYGHIYALTDPLSRSIERLRSDPDGCRLTPDSKNPNLALGN